MDQIQIFNNDEYKKTIHKNFSKYLYVNYKLKKNGTYEPKDFSRNEYRHFGYREPRIMFFYIEDVLYLFSNDENVMEVLCDEIKLNEFTMFLKVYYHIRNSGFNLLRSNDGFNIYLRTKDFNRKNAKPIFKLKFVKKGDVFSFIKKESNDQIDNVYSIISKNIYTFIKTKRKRRLSFTYINDYKNKFN